MESTYGSPHPAISPHFLATDDPHVLIISDETPNFLLCGWYITWEPMPPSDDEICVVCIRGEPYLARYVGEGEVVLRCPHWEGAPRLVRPDRIMGKVVSARCPRLPN